jgi:hypothetical protein
VFGLLTAGRGSLCREQDLSLFGSRHYCPEFPNLDDPATAQAPQFQIKGHRKYPPKTNTSKQQICGVVVPCK